MNTQQTELNNLLNSVLDQVIHNPNYTEHPFFNIYTKPQTKTTTPTSTPVTNTAKKTTVPTRTSSWYNVTEGFEYHLDVPGFTKDELSIVYEDKTRSVTVSGTKTTQIGDYSLGRTVNQVLRLPEEAQTTITATLENGVLVLSVPREVNVRRVITIL